MRKIFERERPVLHEGREIALPYTGEGATGLGKPLRSILHMNPNIPIWLGTGTPANVRLTAEIADGWLPLGYVPARSSSTSAPGSTRASAAPAAARASTTSKSRSAPPSASPTMSRAPLMR